MYLSERCRTELRGRGGGGGGRAGRGARERKGEEGEGTSFPFTLVEFGLRTSCFLLG